jgi:hypothetical protein
MQRERGSLTRLREARMERRWGRALRRRRLTQEWEAPLI